MPFLVSIIQLNHVILLVLSVRVDLYHSACNSIDVFNEVAFPELDLGLGLCARLERSAA